MHCAQGDINTVIGAQRGIQTQNWDGGGWSGKVFRCRMIKGGNRIMKREFSKEGVQKVRKNAGREHAGGIHSP